MKVRLKISFGSRAAALLACLLVFSAGCGGGGGAGVGDRGGDGVAPVLKMTAPVSASLSDTSFINENFQIKISYQDTSPRDMGTLNVTLKMDGGSAQDITSYFSTDNTGAIASAGLYVFTRSLFELATNQSLRVMTINFSIKDIYQNQGSGTSEFSVYPQGVPPPPGD